MNISHVNEDELKINSMNKNNYLSLLLRSLVVLTSIGVCITFVLAVLGSGCLIVFDTYIYPLLDYTDQLDSRFNVSNWQNRDSLVFYERTCGESDLKDRSQETILWDGENMERYEDLTEMVMIQGAGIIPNLLDSETAKEMRKVIRRMNLAEPQKKQFIVRDPSHRWMLRLNPYDYKHDPEGVVRRGMKMIASNPTLRTTLEDILAPDPAINEIAAITSEPGAKIQSYHSDVWYDGSAYQFSRTYSSQYSLFIYLQDTYEDMGSSGFCVGTHVCSKVDETFNHDDFCFNVESPAGAGILINGHLMHQGGANTAHHRLDSGTRVMIVISFSSARRPDTDQRLLPLGSVYAIPWYLWGHNLNDMLTMDTKKWNILHSLGIIKYGKSYGYNYLLGAVSSHGEHGYNGFEEEWFLERDVWEDFHDLTMKAGKEAIKVYLLVISFSLMSMQMSGKTTIQTLGIIKLFIFCLTFLTFICSCLCYFSFTDFAQGITSGRRFRQVPFRALKSSDLTMEYLQNITEPKTYDILYGERLDAYYLFKYVYFYDYHPGNQFFLDTVKKYAFDYIHVPFMLREKFIQQRVMKEVDDHPETIRFLIMNDFGHWSVMEKKFAFEVVRKELLNTNFPVVRILSKEIDFILSQAKYGDGGRGKSAVVSIATAMSRKYIPDLVNALKSKIYSEANLLQNQKPLNSEFFKKKYLQNPSPIELPSKHKEKNLYDRNILVLAEISNSKYQSLITYGDRRHYGRYSLQEEILKYGNLQRLDANATEENAWGMINYMENYPIRFMLDDDYYSGERIRVNEILRLRETCKNFNGNCLHWAVSGFCNKEQYQEYMLEHCLPSCEACHL